MRAKIFVAAVRAVERRRRSPASGLVIADSLMTAGSLMTARSLLTAGSLVTAGPLRLLGAPIA